MRKKAGFRKGQTVIEFTLVGIPLIFVLISIFEISRGMWVYETLAHTVREANRFAIVHGRNCHPSVTNIHNCTQTVGSIATRLRQQGTGLDPNLLQLTFRVINQADPNLNNASTAVTGTLASLSGNTTLFPPITAFYYMDDISITGKYPFRSALAMFWPGAAPVRFSPVIWMSADARELIQF